MHTYSYKQLPGCYDILQPYTSIYTFSCIILKTFSKENSQCFLKTNKKKTYFINCFKTHLHLGHKSILKTFVIYYIALHIDDFNHSNNEHELKK